MSWTKISQECFICENNKTSLPTCLTLETSKLTEKDNYSFFLFSPQKNQKKKEARDQDKNMVLLLRNFLMTYIDKDKRLLQLISIRSIVLRLRNNWIKKSVQSRKQKSRKVKEIKNNWLKYQNNKQNKVKKYHQRRSLAEINTSIMTHTWIIW